MRSRLVTPALAVLAATFGIALTLTLNAAWQVPASGLLDAVQAALPQSRVDNPVTAVLLDYRGYDTLLELGVLLLAWIAATASVADRGAGAVQEPALERSMGRLLLAPMILVSGYLLWAGADAPGGAFQAGAIGAAAAVAWRLSSQGNRVRRTWRALAPLGFAVFLGVGLGTLVTSGVFLDYPLAAVRELMLIIELAAAVSVAVILADLYDAVRASAGGKRDP